MIQNNNCDTKKKKEKRISIQKLSKEKRNLDERQKKSLFKYIIHQYDVDIRFVFC